jgi:ketosteroid isomerase-like protein
MKINWICCLLGFLALSCSAALQAQATGGTEKAIAALEQQWLRSQKASDPDLLAPLLAEKFVNTGSEGTVTAKAATLALVKAAKYANAEYSDVKVAVFGDTAIATGTLTGNGTDAAGKPFVVNERWTDTWVKMPSGKWQCVASHASAIKT